MGPFPHILVTTVLACLVRETGARKVFGWKFDFGLNFGQPTELELHKKWIERCKKDWEESRLHLMNRKRLCVDLLEYTEEKDKEQLLKDLGGNRYWKIQTENVASESDFDKRFERHKDKTIAVYFGNRPATFDRLNIVRAARMFAKHNIRNGIFLYVDWAKLSDRYREKNKITRGTLSFDFDDKFQRITITSKEEYDKRHDTYKGKEIYIIFDSPTIKTKEICVKNRMKNEVDMVRSWYTDQYTKVVWLDVDVDLLGEDYVAGLCPNRKTPYCYPMMYQEVSGKVTGVMGGRQSFNKFWPCEKN